MDKQQGTYRISWILIGMAAWEVLFWLLFGGLLWLSGYFHPSEAETHLAFRQEDTLWFLWLIVPCGGIFLWFLDWKNRRYHRLGNSRIRGIILQPVSSLNTFLRFFFFRNALAFTIIAMAQPVFGTRKVSATVESLEMVIALDISTSMNVKDVDPGTSRLDIAKRAMIQLVNNLHGEKLGIVVFAGGAYVQLPLTSDYDAAKMYIHEISTDMVSFQGTHIAAALEVASQMFSKSKSSTRAVILVTDGEDHEGGTDASLALLKEKKIGLSVLGLGTPAGGLVPNDPDRPEMGYKTDGSGSPVLSRMNPAMIRDLAQRSGGFSTVAENAYPDLTALLTQINQLKRSKIDNFEFDVKENRYQLPLALGILCWVLFVLWSGNSSVMLEKWLQKK